jgi:D-alanyl-D-alanine carboxypeptidase
MEESSRREARGALPASLLEFQGKRVIFDGTRLAVAPETPPASFALRDTAVYTYPALSAERALLADLGSGEVYVGLHGDGDWPLASLTKLMTAAVAARNMNLSEEVTVPPLSPPPAVDGRVLLEGERYTVRDLLRAVLVASNNESAESLASHYGKERFLAAMNALAASWGMEETSFRDVTGLSPKNRSTPQDLLRLSQHLFAEQPEVFAMTRARTVEILDRESGFKKVLPTTSAFAGGSGFLGGKTGYTDEAGGNLLSLFRYAGRPILIVVLGTADRFGETEKLLQWFKEQYARAGQQQ